LAAGPPLLPLPCITKELAAARFRTWICNTDDSAQEIESLARGALVNKTAKPVCAGRKHHQTRHAVHALSAIHPVCGTRDLAVFGSLFSPVSMLRIAMLKVPAISFAAV
jgi:hypothetical protein